MQRAPRSPVTSAGRQPGWQCPGWVTVGSLAAAIYYRAGTLPGVSYCPRITSCPAPLDLP
eukprot:764608-Hanusia_phi.AAC.2